MIVKDSGVDRCGSVVWATDPCAWGTFVADSDAETTYVREKLGERRIRVVAEVVAYSLWINRIGGQEGWVTGCDQGKARGGIGATAVVSFCGQKGHGDDSGDERYSLWIEGMRGEGRVTGCDEGDMRGGIVAWAVVLSCGEEGGEGDSGDEGCSLWTEGIGGAGWVTGCDQGGRGE